MTPQTTTLAAPADAPPDPGRHRQRWLILAVLGLAQLMVVLDATIVNIALPAAQADLGFGDGSRQWVVIAYALTFGSLLLLGGKLADLFGRRTTFLTGLTGFALASAVGGAATSFEMLVAARAGQGVFGALLAPSALSLLTVTFTDPSERAKAFGIFGALAGGGGAIGLLLGGALTEWANWRWCLYVNLAFAAVAFAGAYLLLPRRDHATTRPKLDIPGVLTASAGLFAVVYGFSHAETAGWADPATVAWLGAGAVLIALFAYLQTRAAHPLLPLRVVAHRTRGGAYLSVFIIGAGMFAVFLFLTYYLQTALGYSPVANGLAFLPMVAMIVAASTTSSAKLLPRFGPKPLIVTGMLLAAAGMALLAQLDLDSAYATHILPALLLMGLGMGSVMSPSIQSAVSGVDPHDAGVASAMVNTMQQVGGSIGTALLSTLAASASTGYLAGRAPAPAVAAQAAMEGYTTAFTAAAVIFAVGAAVVLTLLPSGRLAPARPGQAPVAAH